MKKIFFTNLRLNLENKEDLRAWEHLQRMDKSVHKSYSRIFVTAVNAFFEQPENSEDAFLQKVQETISKEIRKMSSASSVTVMPSDTVRQQNIDHQEEAESIAMDFVDGF